jgi:hypothetical protein
MPPYYHRNKPSQNRGMRCSHRKTPYNCHPVHFQQNPELSLHKSLNVLLTIKILHILSRSNAGTTWRTCDHAPTTVVLTVPQSFLPTDAAFWVYGLQDFTPGLRKDFVDDQTLTQAGPPRRPGRQPAGGIEFPDRIRPPPDARMDAHYRTAGGREGAPGAEETSRPPTPDQA